MRIDKFLKVSRIIKRRTVANDACDGEHVVVNGKNELKRLSEIFGKSGLERYFRFKQECLKGAVAKIESLNPLAVLTRGYAVALKDGKAVTKSSQLQTGDVVDIRLSEGRATAKIQESVK